MCGTSAQGKPVASVTDRMPGRRSTSWTRRNASSIGGWAVTWQAALQNSGSSRRAITGRTSPRIDAHDQVGRLPAALGHVDVRIGVEADDGGGGIEPALRVVAVQVEGGDDRAARPDRSAHGLDEVAVAVVDALDDHGPVQIEQHAVDGPSHAWPADRGTRS